MYLYWRIKQQAVPFFTYFLYLMKKIEHEIDKYYKFYNTFVTD